MHAHIERRVLSSSFTPTCAELYTKSLWYRLILTFTDDFSRFSFVLLLQSKSEVFATFQVLDTPMYNQFAWHIS